MDLQAAIAEARSDPDQHCGPYFLLEELARGTFGTVHRAWDPKAERLVAVKLLTRLNANLRQRFTREIKAGSRLEHTDIVGVIDSGEHERQPYLVMELVEGSSLAELAPLSAQRTAQILARVARAIQFAHEQGVLHRDLKPENILVVGEQDPRILDFGLARFTQPEGPKLTRTGEMVGSPLYMSPEQAGGVFSERTDVYALGAVLFQTLTGRPPLQAETLDDYLDLLERKHPPRPSKIVRGLPPELDTICLTCLAKDPDQRYPSAAEVACDLERWLAGEEIMAAEPSLPHPLLGVWPWALGILALIAIATAAALLASG